MEKIMTTRGLISLKEKLSAIFSFLSSKKEGEKEDEKPYVEVKVNKDGKNIRVTLSEEDINKAFADAWNSVVGAR